MITIRNRITVRGIVQGVGFRPFVYGLAVRLGLGGFVRNDAAGVTIEIEGDRAAVDAFVAALRNEAPPLARIETLAVEALSLQHSTSFAIIASAGGARTTLIAPDTAPCADCLRELADPADRRYRYPFLNCTNCGPRFTIVDDIPYDRAHTTMAVFPMCPVCAAEYADPLNRRFHAQPTACPTCGPQLAYQPAPVRTIPSGTIPSGTMRCTDAAPCVPTTIFPAAPPDPVAPSPNPVAPSPNPVAPP
jgi:hydrogenase maturation protein HypF